jgi:hypothetical protein
LIRQRVREQWSDEQLAEIYAGPHDHRVLSPGHDVRIEATVWIGKFLYWPDRPNSVGDLSCGNGYIANELKARKTYLGDFASGFEFCGPISQTIHEIPEIDLFICAETLEHLWEPDEALTLIRDKADKLVASVPLVNDPSEEQNGEHYWAFDREGAEQMFIENGWTLTRLFAEVPAAPGSFYQTYRCGIWGMEKS